MTYVLNSCAPINEVKPSLVDNGFGDIYADTWVATDALGRSMPTYEKVGSKVSDQRRVTGMMYTTWHTQDFHKPGQDYNADVTYILKTDPEARFNDLHPLWYTDSYHWGEPEMGYFLSQDEWVIRRDMSMLADAGVDMLILDVTNAVYYWDEWEKIFSVMLKMKEEGNKVPKFSMWVFNGPVITVAQKLYEGIYKKSKYKDLWFYWDDKPLLLYNDRPSFDANGQGIVHPNPNYDPKASIDANHPHYMDPDYTEEFYKDYTKEVKDFFTTRTMWWGYYEWGGERYVGTEDHWSFGYNLADKKVKSLTPLELLSTHKGSPEQGAVTAAQHPVSMTEVNMGVGKSWSREYGQPSLNTLDMPVMGHVPWLGRKVEHPEAYGVYFQERWDEMIEADPEFIYINDWNEWTALKFHPSEDGISQKPTGKTTPWLGRDNPFIFVDQYNGEFNRCIQPMKGGYGDNYYMQMVQNIRNYKGVRPIPINNGIKKIKIDGTFDDWENILVEYRDTRGDIVHRDHPGYGNLHYTDNSGRNDIVTCKVAVTKNDVCFYVETDKPLTPYMDTNWMLLLIDADQNSKTGWNGYDFLVQGDGEGIESVSIKAYQKESRQWKILTEISFKYSENKLELSIPNHFLGVPDQTNSFDFKWTDNPKDLIEVMSFSLYGDTAPNRRFNYRFKWEE